MHKTKLLGLVILVALVLPLGNIVLVKGAGTGYLAIKDYLGKTWTIDDIQKIINYYYRTSDGENKSLADYFWVVVDNDPKNQKYNLRDFIASPLDNKTAVLPLPAGDHYIDIYWFGYHQRQLVHIVENTHYVLNLETAPVVPFKTAGKPPSSAEWDLVANPEGLTVARRDGKAWVRFNYNTSYITVAWYDDDTGWNYQALDVYVDTSYSYDWFHITDPANPEYSYSKTGSFLWLSWDIYKVEEMVKWNRTGEILHVTYTIVIAENEALWKGAQEFWSGVASTIVGTATQFINPVTGTIIKLKGFVDFVHSAYDTYMGMVYSSKYQRTVLLIWDVFVTPTQIIVLAHAYDVQSDGTVVKKQITSANALIIDNRLVYIRQLQGGYAFQYIYNHDQITFSYSASYTVSINPGKSFKVYDFGGLARAIIVLPVPYEKFYLDDLSMYSYELIYDYTYSLDWYIRLHFNETSKADIFANNLDMNAIKYTREQNDFWITLNGVSLDDIEKLIPVNSPGFIEFGFTPKVINLNSNTYPAGRYQLYIHVVPKLEPPRISLLKDGYQKINKAFAVQVYTDLFREDKDVYMLGYYILDNNPPPSYIIRDVYYDLENDVIHYVYTVIPLFLYGQDIVVEKGSFDNPSRHIYVKAYNSAKSTSLEIKYIDDNITITYRTGNTYTKYFKLTLTNGREYDLWYSSATSGSFQINITSKLAELNISANNVLRMAFYDGGDWDIIITIDGHVMPWQNTEIQVYMIYDRRCYNYKEYIPDTVENNIINNVTLALFSFSRMAFLNLAPDIINKLILMVPPNQGGYGVPIIDWSSVSIASINMTRSYELYYWDKSNAQWVRVKPVFHNDTLVYDIVRYADNVEIESLPPGNTSKYYYKLVYTDTNETLKGLLFNDKGKLKIITGKIVWSVPPELVKKMIELVNLKGIMDKLAEQWNKIAQQLGLITNTLNNIMGAYDWLQRNWWLILGGAFLFLLLIIMIAGASKPRIIVATR